MSIFIFCLIVIFMFGSSVISIKMILYGLGKKNRTNNEN